MRERAQQSWPALSKTAYGATAAACSRSASAKITFADLPPSSSVTRLIVPAAPCMTLRPTSVEPVKPIFATCGCSTRRCPTTRPGPTTTLTTPSGIPASSASSASRSVESGVSSAGLSTTVFPHASAGRHGAPLRERRARPRDRVVGLVGAGLLDLGQRLLGCGVQDGERAHARDSNTPSTTAEVYTDGDVCVHSHHRDSCPRRY